MIVVVCSSRAVDRKGCPLPLVLVPESLEHSGEYDNQSYHFSDTIHITPNMV